MGLFSFLLMAARTICQWGSIIFQCKRKNSLCLYFLNSTREHTCKQCKHHYYQEHKNVYANLGKYKVILTVTQISHVCHSSSTTCIHSVMIFLYFFFKWNKTWVVFTNALSITNPKKWQNSKNVTKLPIPNGFQMNLMKVFNGMTKQWCLQ